MIEKLVGWAIDHKAVTAAVFGLLCIAGIISWNALSIDAYPDISDTTVQVVTQVPGLATEEIEQQISIPVERAVSGIPNLVTMRSKNSFGLSTVILVFDDGVDDYWARQRVTERLTGIELPYGAVPELNPLTAPTGEIFRYIVESPDGSHDLRSLTDIHKWTIIPYLRQISGVADVSNYGGITTQYQIELLPDRLTEYGISLADITEKIEQNNLNAGGSILSEGSLSYVVRGIGLISDLEGLGDIVVKTVNGTPVYLKELGNLQYDTLERKGVLGFRDDEHNYDDAVEGIVQMLRGENPSEVLERVHTSIDELNNEILPKGVKIHPFLDRTSLVGETLKTVSHTLLIGMLLVIVVLMIFLGNFRGSLVVAITIPIALLVAFVFMKLTGIPANLLSLGAVDFGILVDGAIVMMENILKKRERHPDQELTAGDAKQRASEVARSIFFSTIIIITAYLPLFAFEHVERKLFTPMAYTVGYALIGALLTSLLLTPALSYLAYRKPRKLYHNKWLEKINNAYNHHIGVLIEKSRAVIVVLLLILGGSIVLSITVGKDFLPPLDEGSVWVQVQLPPGLSIEKSKKMADDLRDVLKEFDETSYVMTQLGRDDEGAECFSLSHIEAGVGLKPYNTWKSGRNKAELVEAMSKAIEKMPGYSAGFSQPIIDMVMDQIAGTHSDLALKIYSDDIDESRRVAEEVANVVAQIEGASDVAVDQEPPTPQLQISVNRTSIAQYGLNVSDVTELIELAIGGRAISQIYVGSKVYDITCRYAEQYRNTPEKIGNLMLTTADGVKVPLSAVADIKMSLGASTIMREMSRRYTLVRINLRGADLTTFVEKADKLISQQVQYDHEKTSLHWAGQFENRNRAFNRLGLVVPLALMVMFILLIFAFGKVRQAGLLMSVVPLALFGGMLALNVRGMTLNVSSAVGFIALIGVAIQNGIIMISHINHLRLRGYELKRAVIEGASHRMRPVLLTASVAVLGLFPASISTGIGSDVQRPLATVIVYGLIFATIVTLFILPTLYYMMEKRVAEKAALQVSEPSDKPKGHSALKIIIPLIAMLPFAANGQNLDYTTFINRVMASNLDYAAAKLDLSISQADLTAAKKFTDPTITAEYGNNSDWDIAMGQSLSFGLEKSISFGKRAARIRVARNLLDASDAGLQYFTNTLRAEATLAYIDALLARDLARIGQQNARNMASLYHSDSLRHATGELSEIDVMQTRLESNIAWQEYRQLQADYRNALVELDQLMGIALQSTDSIVGNLGVPTHLYSLQNLLQGSDTLRMDIVQQQHMARAAESELTQVRRERMPDIDLSLGVSYNSRVRNEEAPAPEFVGYTVGVGIPLPVSNLNRGEIRSGQYKVRQAQIQTDIARRTAHSEIIKAYNNYLSALNRLSDYNTFIMDNAQQVLDGKLYAYRRGETSLLEVINAQHTYNELQQSYAECLHDCLSALVELESASGIWDITLE